MASHAGAVVPNLLNIVKASGNMMAACYYAISGKRQARELLEAEPRLAIHVATEALHTAPETVIPLLLDLAVSDPRELHNTPDQLLRLAEAPHRRAPHNVVDPLLVELCDLECLVVVHAEALDETDDKVDEPAVRAVGQQQRVVVRPLAGEAGRARVGEPTGDLDVDLVEAEQEAPDVAEAGVN